MKVFVCACGNRVFFDNSSCLACGRVLGFDFADLAMRAMEPAGQALLTAANGRRYRLCANRIEHDNCNWLIAEQDPQHLCPSCRMNEVIPALDRPGNILLWTRVEQAKRRLLYSLAKLRLPLTGPDGSDRLRFRFLEDRRRNPDVLEYFVPTAHHAGVITINIAEADDAARHAVREEMHERYRTVLGHLRHECGHFYFDKLVDNEELLAQCRQLFGDERADYSAAVENHYAQGAPPDWPERFVSAYASAHPSEDFADTFAHYIHIRDGLETADALGLARRAPGQAEADDWIGDWVRLSIALNELLRSLGSDDPYPFVIGASVREKLEFIDRLLRRPA